MPEPQTDAWPGLDPEALYMDRGGHVGCAKRGHVPFPLSDTWEWQDWQRVTPEFAAEYAQLGDRSPMRCEICGKEFVR